LGPFPGDGEASDPSCLDSIARYKDIIRPLYPRTRTQTRALLDGFDPVEPGVTLTVAWRPDDLGEHADDPSKAGLRAGRAQILTPDTSFDIAIIPGKRFPV
jgi:hypothetical protein